MISPALYNMLLYNAYHGRKDHWEVTEERLYNQRNTAFGRTPLVIHLGDFLQLRPTAALSLTDDPRVVLEENPEQVIFVENQCAAKLFMATPICHELRGSNRFKDPRLKSLINYMRSPTHPMPDAIKAYWEQIQMKTDVVDSRLLLDRFQTGHMLGIYWETVARWVLMRAVRDAKALRTPLYLIQAADTSTPPMPRDLAAKLTTQFNPQNVGGRHGMLAVHLGMRMRLIDNINQKQGLVKNAEGTVVHIAVHAADEARVAEAFDTGSGHIYLTHVPHAIWLRMDKYSDAPFTAELEEHDADLVRDRTEALVCIEPSAQPTPFTWRGYSVMRLGFPLSHAQVRTSTNCQGQTLRGGIVVDCARREGGSHPMSPDNWWLHLYVMLSRATRLDDLLLVRAPDLSFLQMGPPKMLREALGKFDRRVKSCRVSAEKLARELGLSKFLR